MKLAPGSQAQVLTAATSRHIIPVQDIDRPDLTNLFIPAVAASQSLAGDGVPVDYDAAVAASLVVGSVAANSDLTFTAVTPGAAGNSYTVAITQAITEDAPLTIVQDGLDTVILLPTDALGDPVAATAAQVKAAWDGLDIAAAVAVAFEGTGAGAVDVFVADNLASGADEVAGTGSGTAGPGSIYVDHSVPAMYINTGTAEEPVWTAL